MVPERSSGLEVRGTLGKGRGRWMLKVDLLGTPSAAESLNSTVARGGREEFEASLAEARETQVRSRPERSESDRTDDSEPSREPAQDDVSTRVSNEDPQADRSRDTAEPTPSVAVFGEVPSVNPNEPQATTLVSEPIVSANPAQAGKSSAPIVMPESAPTVPVLNSGPTLLNADSVSDGNAASGQLKSAAVVAASPVADAKKAVATSEAKTAAEVNSPSSLEVGTSVSGPKANAAANSALADSESGEGALAAARLFAEQRAQSGSKPPNANESIDRSLNPQAEEAQAMAQKDPGSSSGGQVPVGASGTPTAQAETLASSNEVGSAGSRSGSVDPGVGDSSSSSSNTTSAPEAAAPARDLTAKVDVMRATVSANGEDGVAELPPRILRMVRQALRRQTSELKIQLDPPQLGRVDVEFKIGKGRLGVRFEVDSEEVKSALLEDMDRLEEALAAFQAESGSVEVEVRDRPASEDRGVPSSGGSNPEDELDPSDDSVRQAVATPEHLGQQIDRRL